MRRIIERILYHFIFTKKLSETKDMKVGCQIVFLTVLKVFAVFCNAMYYSGPKISYMPFKVSLEMYRLNRLYHFYKTTIAVLLVNMDFNNSYIFMENLLGNRDFKTDVRTFTFKHF